MNKKGVVSFFKKAYKYRAFLLMLLPAVDVNARLMGNTVGRQLINFPEGRPYSEKTIIDYEIQLRKSTEHVNGG